MTNKSISHHNNGAGEQQNVCVADLTAWRTPTKAMMCIGEGLGLFLWTLMDGNERV